MDTPTDLAAFTAAELAAAYRSGETTPTEVCAALLARIGHFDPLLNGFCHVDPDAVMVMAEASQRRLRDRTAGPLEGVPVAVKDFFATAGWPTRKGSRLVDPAGPWDSDAPAVRRLREAGAILIGKTTTPEFGWKGLTDSALTGVTRNPWDPALTPGGSSGGSAVALAMGMAPLALGTDGGGSIRIPGSFTGTVGLKPTFGRVPYAPMSAFGTLAHAGPMARTVADAKMLYDVIAVYDRADWTALPTVAPQPIRDGVAGLRIMFSPALGFAEVAPDVGRAVAEAVALLEDAGAKADLLDPGIPDCTPIWETLWYTGAAGVVDGLDESRLSEVDPGLLEIAETGRSLTALDHNRAFRERVAVASRLGEVLDDYDVLVTPTMPIDPFEVGREVPAGWPKRRWQSWSPFSLPFNLSQQPAATVPCGLSDAGLPIGMQIVAAKHREDLVWQTAAAYERLRGPMDGFGRPLSSPGARS